MKQLFPAEIQQNSVQSHFVKRQTSSKIIYLVIILVLLAAITSLPFIYIDVSTQSRSSFRSPNENNGLQSAVNGEITRIEISENKNIQIGDTLVWLRTDEIDEQMIRIQQKQIENEQFIRDIESLLSGKSKLESPKYITENTQYKAKLNSQDVVLNQAKKEYQVSKTLYGKGVESKYDYEQTESKYHTEQSQYKLLQQQQHSTWQAENTRLEYENRDLNSELQQLEKRKTQFAIIAPVSGNIVQYSGLQTGNFITAGQAIAQISSTDSLLVECFVSPNDIGYIEVGQKVDLQVDAFNYQQWGLLHGSVKEIISDVVQIDNQVFFRVRCSLDQNFLQLPNGYKGNVKKGMTATTRFFLTRRSLSQLLFDKINDWLNPKILTDGNKG